MFSFGAGHDVPEKGGTRFRSKSGPLFVQATVGTHCGCPRFPPKTEGLFWFLFLGTANNVEIQPRLGNNFDDGSVENCTLMITHDTPSPIHEVILCPQRSAKLKVPYTV